MHQRQPRKPGSSPDSEATEDLQPARSLQNSNTYINAIYDYRSYCNRSQASGWKRFWMQNKHSGSGCLDFRPFGYKHRWSEATPPPVCCWTKEPPRAECSPHSWSCSIQPMSCSCGTHPQLLPPVKSAGDRTIKVQLILNSHVTLYHRSWAFLYHQWTHRADFWLWV